jgi:hypothetical protein
MNWQIKRRMLVGVVLGSLVMVGASEGVIPQAATRDRASLFLLSQYRAATGDGEGAVDALLAATEDRASSTASAHANPGAPARTTACRVRPSAKRT